MSSLTSTADLAVLARRQGGAWTHEQARAAGCSPAQIRQLLRGRWASPYRGVYVSRVRFTSLDRDGRHVALAAARVLSTQLGAVASHRTAALVHGFAVLGPPPAVPVLTRAPGHPGDHSSTSTVKVATLPDFSRTQVDGVPVTSLARTAGDVARTTSRQHALVTLDAALREGASLEELATVVELCRRWPGGGRLVEAVAMSDPRAQTPIESLTRLRYREFGLAAPKSQVEVYAPDGACVGLVDFAFPEHGVIGEADGMLKYRDHSALREEKQRQELLDDCGFEVLRNNWDEALTVHHAVAFRARAVRAFAKAATRVPVPGVRLRVPPLEELRRRQRRAA